MSQINPQDERTDRTDYSEKYDGKMWKSKYWYKKWSNSQKNCYYVNEQLPENGKSYTSTFERPKDFCKFDTPNLKNMLKTSAPDGSTGLNHHCLVKILETIATQFNNRNADHTAVVNHLYTAVQLHQTNFFGLKFNKHPYVPMAVQEERKLQAQAATAGTATDQGAGAGAVNGFVRSPKRSGQKRPASPVSPELVKSSSRRSRSRDSGDYKRRKRSTSRSPSPRDRSFRDRYPNDSGISDRRSSSSYHRRSPSREGSDNRFNSASGGFSGSRGRDGPRSYSTRSRGRDGPRGYEGDRDKRGGYDSRGSRGRDDNRFGGSRGRDNDRGGYRGGFNSRGRDMNRGGYTSRGRDGGGYVPRGGDRGGYRGRGTSRGRDNNFGGRGGGGYVSRGDRGGGFRGHSRGRDGGGGFRGGRGGFSSRGRDDRGRGRGRGRGDRGGRGGRGGFRGSSRGRDGGGFRGGYNNSYNNDRYNNEPQEENIVDRAEKEDEIEDFNFAATMNAMTENGIQSVDVDNQSQSSSITKNLANLNTDTSADKEKLEKEVRANMDNKVNDGPEDPPSDSDSDDL